MHGAKYLALLALAATASSESVKRETAKYCPGGTTICFSESRIAEQDITFRIAIPETAAAPFDVLLQIVAPVSVTWASIAWGGKMTGNPLTVGWPNGKSAVVSSRWATGRTLPGAYAGASYTVLPSTATNATHWQLDVLCRGCSQWTGGSLNPNGQATFAWAKGSRAVTTPASNTSNFAYHDTHGSFGHDLAAAKIPQGVFDAVAYDLSKGEPAASSAPAVATSAATLPTTKLTSSSFPTTGISFVTGIPDVPFPTTNNLPTSAFVTATFPTFPVVATSVATLAPVVTRTTLTRTASPVVPTRVTVLPSLNPGPGPSTTFVIITTRVTTISRPTTTTRVVVPTVKPSGPSVVTVTVTRKTTAPAPQPTYVQPPGPPWRGGRPPGRGGPPFGRGRGGRPTGEEVEEDEEY